MKSPLRSSAVTSEGNPQDCAASPFAEDRDDKNNASYTFTPPVNYTPQEVQAGQEIVSILNDPDKSESEKKDGVWNVLNKL